MTFSADPTHIHDKNHFHLISILFTFVYVGLVSEQEDIMVVAFGISCHSSWY